MKAVRYRLERHVDGSQLARIFADDVRRGLTSPVKSLPPKYFYDAAGSALFEAITMLPEYYVTRAEERLARDLRRRRGPDGPAPRDRRARRRRLHESGALHRRPPRQRTAVCAPRRRSLGAGRRRRRLLGAYPFLDVHAVVGDFERHLDRVPGPSGRRLVIFLGSTIGNLDEDARHTLLGGIYRLLDAGDRLLLGVDLVKDRAVLEPAYADAQGITAEFNRNILRVVNRRLGANFDPEGFRHRAFYNEAAARIEMHLVAERDQRVVIRRLALTVDIAEGESIWTESSYKFTTASTTTMLAAAGLALERWYTDAGQQVGLALATAA